MTATASVSEGTSETIRRGRTGQRDVGAEVVLQRSVTRTPACAL